jgi:hypothetical protein
MADADLDVIIRQLAKQQTKTLTAAAKARRDRYLGLAAKAKDAEAKQRLKLIASTTLEQGTAAAKRLQISADNAADSYARAVRKAAEIAPKSASAQKAPKGGKAPAAEQSSKKSAKKPAKNSKA